MVAASSLFLHFLVAQGRVGGPRCNRIGNNCKQCLESGCTLRDNPVKQSRCVASARVTASTNKDTVWNAANFRFSGVEAACSARRSFVDCDTNQDAWTDYKTEWCCGQKKLGCPAPPPPPPVTHNCYTREVWSEDKKEWCCAQKNLGCPVTHNCYTREVWSEDKKEWCCANKNLGCPEVVDIDRIMCTAWKIIARDELVDPFCVTDADYNRSMTTIGVGPSIFTGILRPEFLGQIRDQKNPRGECVDLHELKTRGHMFNTGLLDPKPDAEKFDQTLGAISQSQGGIVHIGTLLGANDTFIANPGPNGETDFSPVNEATWPGTYAILLDLYGTVPPAEFGIPGKMMPLTDFKEMVLEGKKPRQADANAATVFSPTLCLLVGPSLGIDCATGLPLV